MSSAIAPGAAAAAAGRGRAPRYGVPRGHRRPSAPQRDGTVRPGHRRQLPGPCRAAGRGPGAQAGQRSHRRSVTFVADVGEEGLGDLRGMKQLFGETMKGRIDRFLAIDGTGLFLVNAAVGSRRYRVTFKGPGGHSYAAFGTANPIQAHGTGHRQHLAVEPPSAPNSGRTTFNVGRVGGGTSVNAIPAECWMELDLRSTDAASIAALDAACSGPWTKPCAKRTSAAASAGRSLRSGNSSGTSAGADTTGVPGRPLGACRGPDPRPHPDADGKLDGREHPNPAENSRHRHRHRRTRDRYAYGGGDLRHDRRVEGDSVRGARCDRARSAVKGGRVGRAGRVVGQRPHLIARPFVLQFPETREIGGPLA